MNRTLEEKSTLDDIRRRFDADVERFARLETGQQAAIDAPLILDLVSQVAAGHIRPGARMLDLGCGAGNFTLSVLQRIAPLDCVLVDLSRPMLDRAEQRVRAANRGTIETVHGDMRAVHCADGSVDLIVAGAVLHHLRDDADWRAMFGRMRRWLKCGGLLFVSDLVDCDDAVVRAVQWRRYGEHLESLGGAAYRDKVLAYIDAEDSPRSLSFQLALLRESGFRAHEVLHRNGVFAAFYGVK